MDRRSKKKRRFPFILVVLPTLLISAAGIGSTWLFSEDNVTSTNLQQLAIGTVNPETDKAAGLSANTSTENVAINPPAQNNEQTNPATTSPEPTKTVDTPPKQSSQANSQSGQTSTTNPDKKPSGQTSTQQPNIDLSQIQVPVPLPVDATKVENKAENIVGRDIAMDDFMAAGKIFMRKLTPTEISFIFGAANGRMLENNSVEELENIRKTLLTKLSSQEVATIRGIGKKYGRTMYILDPSASIAELREQHFKELAAQQSNGN